MIEQGGDFLKISVYVYFLRSQWCYRIHVCIFDKD